MQFSCPQCNKQLRVPDCIAGKRISCPNCQCEFTAPELSNSNNFVPGLDERSFSESPKGKDFYVERNLTPSRVRLSSVIGDGWKLITTNFLTCFVGYLIFAMITGVCNMPVIILNVIAEMPDGIDPSFKSEIPVWFFCLSLVSFLVTCFMVVGLCRYNLTLLRGQKPKLMLLFSGLNALERIILVFIWELLILISVVIVTAVLGGVIGLCLFSLNVPEDIVRSCVISIMALLPIIMYIIMLRLSLALTLVADTRCGALVAISYSWKAMKGNVFLLFSISLFMWLVMMLAFLTCCIGLFFVVPYAISMFVIFYLQATGQPYVIKKCE